MSKFKDWLNKPADGLEITILLIACFAIASWDAGCHTFIWNGIIKEDLLKSKIQNPEAINKIQKAGHSR